MSIGNPPESITPLHIDNLMRADRIVVRYYEKGRRLQKLELTPQMLKEYIDHFKEVLGES